MKQIDIARQHNMGVPARRAYYLAVTRHPVAFIERRLAMNTRRPYLSLSDFARACGVSRPTAWEWLHTGRVPGAYLSGRQWFIPSWAKRPASRRKKQGVDASGR